MQRLKIMCPVTGITFGMKCIPEIQSMLYVQAVSTSHPYGDRLEVKNCTKLYRKNPTHYSSSKGSYISEYYGEIFLHFNVRCAFCSICFVTAKKTLFKIV
jgi:hypothetical protein